MLSFSHNLFLCHPTGVQLQTDNRKIKMILYTSTLQHSNTQTLEHTHT